jgi:hypothetical protein
MPPLPQRQQSGGAGAAGGSGFEAGSGGSAGQRLGNAAALAGMPAIQMPPGYSGWRLPEPAQQLRSQQHTNGAAFPAGLAAQQDGPTTGLVRACCATWPNCLEPCAPPDSWLLRSSASCGRSSIRALH